MPRPSVSSALKAIKREDMTVEARKFWRNFGVLGVVIFLVSCSFDDRIVGVAEATVDAPTLNELSYDNDDGDFSIVGIDDPDYHQIEVEATIRARTTFNGPLEEQLLQDFVIELEHLSTSGASLITELSENYNGYYISEVKIRLPSRLFLDISDGSGDLSIEGCSGLNLIDGSGDIHVENVDGTTSVSDESGDLSIHGTSGNLTLTDGSGDLSLRNIGGDIDLCDDSGDLHIQGADGSIQLTDRSGDITISDVDGAIDVQDRDGDLTIQHITGDINVNDESGDISITGAGDVSICDDSGDIFLMQVGEYEILCDGSGDVIVVP